MTKSKMSSSVWMLTTCVSLLFPSVVLAVCSDKIYRVVSAGGQNRPGLGGFKTGHFESLKVRRRAFSAMVPGEAVDGEPAQGGDGAFDFDASGAGMVAARIARELGIHRETVARYLKQAGAGCGPPGDDSKPAKPAHGTDEAELVPQDLGGPD